MSHDSAHLQKMEWRYTWVSIGVGKHWRYTWSTLSCTSINTGWWHSWGNWLPIPRKPRYLILIDRFIYKFTVRSHGTEWYNNIIKKEICTYYYVSFVQFVHMHVYVQVHMLVYNMYTFICMSTICTHSYACVQYVHVQYVHVHMHVYSMYTFRCTYTVCTRSYARVCTRSYARVLYIHVHMHVYCTYTSICMCMYTFICKCMYTFICKCMYTFICMCMCTFICKCMCTLICISHKENLMIDGGGSLLHCILKTGK